MVNAYDIEVKSLAVTLDAERLVEIESYAILALHEDAEYGASRLIFEKRSNGDVA